MQSYSYNAGSRPSNNRCSQVARSSSMPPNGKDTLYQSLPPGVKSALRSKLQSFNVKDEVLLFHLKEERVESLLFSHPCGCSSCLLHCDLYVQLTITEIKDTMEKTLQWLVPLSTNTAKYVMPLFSLPKNRNFSCFKSLIFNVSLPNC
jgi:hypothetical protein